jgi:hypothetical protein
MLAFRGERVHDILAGRRASPRPGSPRSRPPDPGRPRTGRGGLPPSPWSRRPPGPGRAGLRAAVRGRGQGPRHRPDGAAGSGRRSGGVPPTAPGRVSRRSRAGAGTAIRRSAGGAGAADDAVSALPGRGQRSASVRSRRPPAGGAGRPVPGSRRAGLDSRRKWRTCPRAGPASRRLSWPRVRGVPSARTLSETDAPYPADRAAEPRPRGTLRRDFTLTGRHARGVRRSCCDHRSRKLRIRPRPRGSALPSHAGLGLHSGAHAPTARRLPRGGH